ncbi:MAG: tetratricopeptide repeat protein, partial [Acidobacteriota bacterium]
MPTYFGRDYDRSLAQVRRALDLEPNFFLAHYVLGMNYVEKGEFDKGIAAFERCYQLEKQPWMLAGVGFGYARAGKRQMALQVISELENWSKIRHVSAGDIALVYVALGDKERALEWLEKAYQGRSQYMLFLKMGPMWDSLRADPRFQDLVRRVGFDR